MTVSKLTKWKQTFKRDGCAFKNGEVSVYLAGTNLAARVFDTNGKLHDVTPQINTNGSGTVELFIDVDDYPTAQLFDVYCASGGCVMQDPIELKNLMLLQDTEGGRNFKQVFAQTTAPDIDDDNVKAGDMFFDTDNGNRPYRYDGENWIDLRDGSIATAATTANWSEVVDDEPVTAPRPDDGADVTNENTSNNTDYINGSENESGETVDFFGDLKVWNSGNIYFYDAATALVGSVYTDSGELYFKGAGGT